MLYFGESYAKVTFDKEKNIVIAQTKGYMSSEQYRLQCEKYLKCLIENKCNRLLYDQRIFITVRPEDQVWVVQNLSPRLSKITDLKVAVLLPDNFIQQKIIQKIEDETKESESHSRLRDSYRSFSSLQEAMSWLQS